MSDETLNYRLGSGAEAEGANDTKPRVETPSAEPAADGPEHREADNNEIQGEAGGP